MYVKAGREGGGVEDQVGILSVLPESPRLDLTGVTSRTSGEHEEEVGRSVARRRTPRSRADSGISRAEPLGLLPVAYRRASSSIGPAWLCFTPCSPVALRVVVTARLRPGAQFVGSGCG